VVVSRKSWTTPGGVIDVNWLFKDGGDEDSDARWEKMKLERIILLRERMKSLIPKAFVLYTHFGVSDIAERCQICWLSRVRRRLEGIL
jgi:hypothetical protein